MSTRKSRSSTVSAGIGWGPMPPSTIFYDISTVMVNNSGNNNETSGSGKCCPACKCKCLKEGCKNLLRRLLKKNKGGMNKEEGDSLSNEFQPHPCENCGDNGDDSKITS